MTLRYAKPYRLVPCRDAILAVYLTERAPWLAKPYDAEDPYEEAGGES